MTTTDKLSSLLRLAEALGETETSEPAEAAPDHPLIGQRVLVRTRVSGVSIGTLRTFDNTGNSPLVVLDGGHRVWSWSGGALACSELATKGPDSAKTEAHPDGITIVDEGMEIMPVAPAAWDAIVG